jgi:hypothetical protein
MTLLSRFVFAIFAVAGLCSFLPSATTATPPVQQCTSAPALLHFDAADLRLEGKIEQRLKFGPPGYGESPLTDPKVRILVLKLYCPIDVAPQPNAKVSDTPSLTDLHSISEIQLFLFKKGQQGFAKAHLGQRALVSGKLEEGVAGGEYTKVVMIVSKISSKAEIK